MASQDNTATSAKIVRQGSKGPLELEWPAVLREDRWAGHRKRVEAARDRALDQLATTTGISPEADAELRNAVTKLNTDFKAYRDGWVLNEYRNSADFSRICEGTRHIQKLVMSAYQLVEMTNYQEACGRNRFREETSRTISRIFTGTTCAHPPDPIIATHTTAFLT